MSPTTAEKSSDFSTPEPQGDRRDSLRMLDANLNRANEAVRTLEDIARFRDLAAAQFGYKNLRHSLQAITKNWPAQEIWSSRHAAADVGTDQKTDSELVRSGGLTDIAVAAANRLQQSLRCLEEIAKYLFPESAQAIEKLRYASYDLNAASLLSLQRDVAFLRQAKLYLLVDCQLPLPAFSERVADVSRSGVDLIQIRDKQKDAVELLAYVKASREAVNDQQTRIILNDRADIARLSPCFGLHVGQSDLTIGQSRSLLRPESVVGMSTHDVEQVKAAIALGADYVGCGPTFPSTTKSFQSFSGIPFLEQARPLLEEANIPGFAIGGIHAENIREVVRAGFQRVAVSNAIWNAEKPGDAAKRIREMLE
jgi:thiamine-phosphate pyrophosphorylase